MHWKQKWKWIALKILPYSVIILLTNMTLTNHNGCWMLIYTPQMNIIETFWCYGKHHVDASRWLDIQIFIHLVQMLQSDRWDDKHKDRFILIVLVKMKEQLLKAFPKMSCFPPCKVSLFSPQWMLNIWVQLTIYSWKTQLFWKYLRYCWTSNFGYMYVNSTANRTWKLLLKPCICQQASHER